MALRYFNAAGSDPEGELGERHDPETHLIPLVLREALRVKQGGDPAATQLRVFGEDFDTPDGTCVRDYVHVEDLCRAHLIAIRRLLEGKVAGAEGYNLGIGRGFSVKEVIDVCRALAWPHGGNPRYGSLRGSLRACRSERDQSVQGITCSSAPMRNEAGVPGTPHGRLIYNRACRASIGECHACCQVGQ